MSDGEAEPRTRKRLQRGWYVYDWANSGFQTSVITVFLGPYLNDVAAAAADSSGFVHPLGIPVRAGALYPYLVSLSALLQVLAMPLYAALADRMRRRRLFLGISAYIGAAATTSLWFIKAEDYLVGAGVFLLATVAYGCSIVIYHAFLPDIAGPDERDAVSSRGWALGYLGGGLLLAGHLALFNAADSGALGMATSTAVRLSIASAGLWWALFTIVPLLALRGVREPPSREASLSGGFRQLRGTLRKIRAAPATLAFLVAYLLYNDGIQTVISQAAVFADAELGMGEGTIASAVLLVQIVAVVGALVLGWLAGRYGAKRVILASLVIWAGVLAYAFVLPEGATVAFFSLAGLIGVVLGGSQALSRSLFSQMVPDGAEAEYFSAYEISDRGTSWLGPLLFGLALQLTGSYRIAIISLLVFFVLGFLLLRRVDVRRAITEAGNPQPERV